MRFIISSITLFISIAIITLNLSTQAVPTKEMENALASTPEEDILGGIKELLERELDKVAPKKKQSPKDQDDDQGRPMPWEKLFPGERGSRAKIKSAIGGRYTFISHSVVVSDPEFKLPGKRYFYDGMNRRFERNSQFPRFAITFLPRSIFRFKPIKRGRYTNPRSLPRKSIMTTKFAGGGIFYKTPKGKTRLVGVRVLGVRGELRAFWFSPRVQNKIDLLIAKNISVRNYHASSASPTRGPQISPRSSHKPKIKLDKLPPRAQTKTKPGSGIKSSYTYITKKIVIGKNVPYGNNYHYNPRTRKFTLSKVDHPLSFTVSILSKPNQSIIPIQRYRGDSFTFLTTDLQYSSSPGGGVFLKLRGGGKKLVGIVTKVLPNGTRRVLMFTPNTGINSGIDKIIAVDSSREY